MCEQIINLKNEYKKKSPGTQKWPANEPRTDRALEVDEILEQIIDMEIKLGKVLFQKQQNTNASQRY